MNFQFGERPFEIVTGPGRIAQKSFEEFAEEYNYNISITSPTPGELLMHLHDVNGDTITDKDQYVIFLNQFQFLDERFRPSSDTKWQSHVVEHNNQPVIKAFYL